MRYTLLFQVNHSLATVFVLRKCQFGQKYVIYIKLLLKTSISIVYNKIVELFIISFNNATCTVL
jgi:hypothetical protein